MIKEIKVNGSVDTTFHNLIFTQSGMSIDLSPFTYYRAGQILGHTDTSGTISLSSSQYQDLYVEIWLATTGIEVVQGDAIDVFDNNPIPAANKIDRLAWFTIPTGATTLDNVEINAIRMVESQ